MTAIPTVGALISLFAYAGVAQDRTFLQEDVSLSIDMNAFAVGTLGGNPLGSLTVVGTKINCQFWGRDTIANGALLSDALEYFVGP